MYRYAINQFAIESSFPLPSAAKRPGDSLRRAALTIDRAVAGRLADQPQLQWVGRRCGSPLRAYSVGEGLLLCVDRYVRFYVHGPGDRITADFEPDDEWAVGFASACAVNLCLSVCTLLRGQLALHGAGVDVDGRRIVIVAPSGTGKSTLLWALLDDGAIFANDDVVPGWLEGEQVIAFASGGLHAKLSRNALELRGLDPAEFEPMLPDREEFWLPVRREQRAEGLAPLAAVFVLQPSLSLSTSVTVHRLLGGLAVSNLMANTQSLWAWTRPGCSPSIGGWRAWSPSLRWSTRGASRCCRSWSGRLDT